MKQIIILLFMVLIYQTGFTQDIDKCNEVVKITIEAINNKSSETLEPYLASDFKIAGQTGEIAKMVMTQLFSQFGETVKSYKIKSSENENNTLTLIYAIEYDEKMGLKDATFVFNSDNKLKELTLFKMEVKTLDGETKVEKNNKDIIKVPFKMAGNLIIVDVLLNGEKRNFLLDSGSPKVILNQKYFPNSDTIHKKSISSTKGVGGNISGMDIVKVEQLDFAGIQLNNQKVLTIDISHLEKELETKIYGLIGYDLIKDYDIIFDYDKKVLTLINPDYYEKYKKNEMLNRKLTIVPFEFTSHIPVIKVMIDKREYSFGIDCGAESNLMDDDLFAQLNNCLRKVSTDTLSGADKIRKEVKVGEIKKIFIGEKKFKNIHTVFNDMSHLNEGYKMKIDGLIGYQVLSKQKTMISYKRKELIFIE